MASTMTTTVARVDAARVGNVGEKQAKPTPARVPHAVRTLAVGEYKAAALTLAEAFWDDDVGRYFLDTPAHKAWTEEQKWDLHLSLFEYLVYAHIMCGLATTAGDDYACVALWMPPGKDTDSLYTLVRSGMWRLHYKLCTEGHYRFFDEFFPLLHETKKAVMDVHDGDSWYLVYLGTKASARGKGLARAVLASTLEQVDAAGKAAYLESSNPVNLAFYARLGFETRKSVTLSRGERGLSLDCMRRDAKRVAGRGVQVEKKGIPLTFDKKPARIEVEVKVKSAPVFAEKQGMMSAASKTLSAF